MPDLPPYHLPRLPYLRLHCALEACEPARLPPYHGSLLRGAFGHALRRSVCTMGPEQPCATCRLRRACVHTRLFETFIEEEPPPYALLAVERMAAAGLGSRRARFGAAGGGAAAEVPGWSG